MSRWSYQPQEQPDGLVAGSLDLLTMLLKVSFSQSFIFIFYFSASWRSYKLILFASLLQNAPIDVVKTIHEVCFHAVIRITLQSEDHGELQVF